MAASGVLLPLRSRWEHGKKSKGNKRIKETLTPGPKIRFWNRFFQCRAMQELMRKQKPGVVPV